MDPRNKPNAVFTLTPDIRSKLQDLREVTGIQSRSDLIRYAITQLHRALVPASPDGTAVPGTCDHVTAGR